MVLQSRLLKAGMAFVVIFVNFTGHLDAVTFVILNACTATVWPGTLSSAGGTQLGGGGFQLLPGQSVSLNVPAGWSGRVWGRTDCNFNSSPGPACESGDCGSRLLCAGAGASPPATLAEFTLASSDGGSARDFYDISLVDGFNLPISIVPAGPGATSTCGTAACSADINNACPSTLQVRSSTDGDVVACKSACLAFQTAQYCCSGAYASPSTCQPSSYSQAFKAACPSAYSYAYDDPTSTFTCLSSAYLITFCPSASSSATNISTSQLKTTTTTTPEGSWSNSDGQPWQGKADNQRHFGLRMSFMVLQVLTYLITIW